MIKVEFDANDLQARVFPLLFPASPKAANDIEEFERS